MKNVLLILPNQLFESSKEHIKKFGISEVYIIEHSYYFTEYNYHKLKLAFLVCCMKNYAEYLKNNTKNLKINYIKYNEDYSYVFKNSKVYSYEFIDKKIQDLFKEYDIENISSDMFLYKKEDLKNITYKRHSAFYNYSKKYIKEKYNIDFIFLQNTDKLNRKTIPKKELQNLKETLVLYKNKHYIYSINYINSNFKNNIGELDIENISMLPCTFKDAKKHLQYFFKNNFNNFGPYQDFISKNHIRLYHSNISHLLNIGLLTPEYVIKQIDNKYLNNKSISINSLEGFVRQIIGWREYMRYLYDNYYSILLNSNTWNSHKKLNWKQFYGFSDTGVEILDSEIQKIKTYAWSHHIIRLMVFLNYFVLTKIDPQDIYRWFMEMCAIDAYDWVMVPNIYAMGYFSKKFTSKAYISSDNYLKKMSNYKMNSEYTELYKKIKK